MRITNFYDNNVEIDSCGNIIFNGKNLSSKSISDYLYTHLNDYYTQTVPTESSISKKRKKKKKTTNPSFGERIDTVQDNVTKTTEALYETTKVTADAVGNINSRVDELNNDTIRHDVEIGQLKERLDQGETLIKTLEGQIMVANGGTDNCTLPRIDYIEDRLDTVEKQQKRMKKLTKLAILGRLL